MMNDIEQPEHVLNNLHRKRSKYTAASLCRAASVMIRF